MFADAADLWCRDTFGRDPSIAELWWRPQSPVQPAGVGLSALTPAESFFSPGITEWLDLDLDLYLGEDDAGCIADLLPNEGAQPPPPPPPPPGPPAPRVTFACTYPACQRVYAKLSHVRAHLRRHRGEKPFRCTWAGCAWRFSRSDELARHRRSHSGDKPYACSLCVKRFARSDHLAKHARVHARRAARATSAASD